jgi:hypothetical protein
VELLPKPRKNWLIGARVISCLQMEKIKRAHLAVRRVANRGFDKNVRRWRINRLKKFGVKLDVGWKQNYACSDKTCPERLMQMDCGVQLLGISESRKRCLSYLQCLPRSYWQATCLLWDSRYSRSTFYLLWWDTFMWPRHNIVLLTSAILKLSIPCISDQCNRLS